MSHKESVHAAQHETMLQLTSGALRLALAPALGGCIARFDCGEFPILRGVRERPDRILETASFPLVPFVNRMRGGRFVFRGREVRLTPNLAGEQSPLHGQGWLAAWNAAQHSEREAELRYHHRSGEWPWAYEARQRFLLSDHALDIELACRNLSNEPMPCGLGQHPYFVCNSCTRIDTQVSHAWTIDEEVLPIGRVQATGRFDLAGRAICGQGLDNGFEGWSGHARIETDEWPFAIELSSPDARFLHVYSPVEGGSFAAEPVTHRSAALNEPEESWDEAGLRILAPGEEMRLRTRIALVSARR